MILKNILQDAKTRLKKSGVDSYALDADLLLGFALKISREEIIKYPERELTNKQVADFHQLLNRRENREPLAYITGKKEFFGHDFKVTRETLIPRPDSESIIEAALKLFKDAESINILDLGTGSGCLLLTLLSEIINARGTGVDKSEAAIEVAKINATNLGLQQRAEFISLDWNDLELEKFDLIISNPPYIKDYDIDNLAPEIKNYEPLSALKAGEDGLDCYKTLKPIIINHLKSNAYVIFECGDDQAEKIVDIMTSELKFINYVLDLSRTKRGVIFRN